jgi:hypothetical protein
MALFNWNKKPEKFTAETAFKASINPVWAAYDLNTTSRGEERRADRRRSRVADDKQQLNELIDIEKDILLSEQSPNSVANITPEAEDAYRKNIAAYAKAIKGAEKGLSDAERNVITTDFAQATNIGQANAQAAGGSSLAPYINSVTNANASKFSLGLAAENERVRREKEQVAQQYLSMLQGSTNPFERAQQLNFQKQMQIEQALGAAKQDWKFNKRQEEIARNQMKMQGIATAGQLGSDYISSGSQAATAAAGSDRRLKENIKHVGVSNGINLYEFNYKGADTKWVGVMSDEVRHIEGAVIQKNGFDYVNYSVIGVEFKKSE